MAPAAASYFSSPTPSGAAAVYTSPQRPQRSRVRLIHQCACSRRNRTSHGPPSRARSSDNFARVAAGTGSPLCSEGARSAPCVPGVARQRCVRGLSFASVWGSPCRFSSGPSPALGGLSCIAPRPEPRDVFSVLTPNNILWQARRRSLRCNSARRQRERLDQGLHFRALTRLIGPPGALDNRREFLDRQLQSLQLRRQDLLSSCDSSGQQSFAKSR